jgi:hypothetical protein
VHTDNGIINTGSHGPLGGGGGQWVESGGQILQSMLLGNDSFLQHKDVFTQKFLSSNLVIMQLMLHFNILSLYKWIYMMQKTIKC